MAVLPFVQIVTVLILGVVAGTHVVGVLGLNPALRALPSEIYVPTKRAIDVAMPRYARPATLAGILLVVACCGVAVVAGAAWIAVLSGVGAVLSIVALLAVLLGDLPINQQMSTWEATRPPPDWRATVARWERFFLVRTIATTAAFAVVTVGAVLPR
jgi:uncharacterized membrane protein